MHEEIVARLRKCWCSDAFSDRGRVDPLCDHNEIREEAADEIEKLRMLGTQLLNAVDYYSMEK